MQYNKIQPWNFFEFGEEDFKCFWPYMGMAVILFNDAEPLTKLIIPLQQKA